MYYVFLNLLRINCATFVTILKSIKHILGVSQLFVFLTFVVLGSVVGLLQSEKNTEADHIHVSIQHKQNTSFEQGVFEFDLEKESEGGEFLKNIACFCSTKIFITPFTSHTVKGSNHLSQIPFQSEPIFLALHHFRI
jgi:hypothetical protein